MKYTVLDPSSRRVNCPVHVTRTKVHIQGLVTCSVNNDFGVRRQEQRALSWVALLET
jgi:hypothetical protein